MNPRLQQCLQWYSYLNIKIKSVKFHKFINTYICYIDETKQCDNGSAKLHTTPASAQRKFCLSTISTTSSRSATKNDRGMNLILKINHRFSFIASKNKDELSSCEFLLCLLKISLKNQFNNWIIRPYFQKIYISSYS